MIFVDGLAKEFKQTEQERNPQARGARFEIIVQWLFERRRFRVVRNPPSASPRQTDLMATRADEQYLIEAKWLNSRRHATVDDIDSLFARLERTPPGVAGVFFSMSGYAKTAIAEVEKGRHKRPILLFGPDETRTLVKGDANLISLLRRKRQVLAVDGQVFFSTGNGLWGGKPVPDRALLPQPADLIWRDTTGVSPWLVGKGRLDRPAFTYTCDVLNSMSPPFLGPGVELNMPLGIHSERDLAYVFDALRKAGWITSAGWWSIRQESVEWHGTGAAILLEALERRDERYSGVDTKLHHSEQIIYADVCEGRFFTLAAYIYVGQVDIGRVRQASISARLPGIPVDPSPIRDLIHAFELDDLAYLRPLMNDDRASVYAQLGWGKYRLEPVALLCPPNQRGVTGIVCRNPLVGETPSDNGDDENTRIREVLNESELLICRLTSWHELGDEVDYYYLTSVHMARTHDAWIVEAVANWNYRVKRIHPQSDQEEGPILDDQEPQDAASNSRN